MMNSEAYLADVLRAAVSGEPSAVEEILQMASPVIQQYSWIDGKIDEDLYQHISLRIFEDLKNFQIRID